MIIISKHLNKLSTLVSSFFNVNFQTIIGDFSKENEKFVNEKKNQQRKEDAAVPPWVGLNEEDRIKEEIMALSSVILFFLLSLKIKCRIKYSLI